MARTIYYSTPQQRQDLKDAAHAIGESNIEDSFLDIDGNDTDGNSGRLIFDVRIADPPTQDQIRVRELMAKLDDGTFNVNQDIKEFLKLAFVKRVR